MKIDRSWTEMKWRIVFEVDPITWSKIVYFKHSSSNETLGQTFMYIYN